MRVLWIGAHPDDELFVAPSLARLRVTAGENLAFLIATRGENGECLLTLREHEDQDLSAIREAEMVSAVAALDGTLQFLGWRDDTAAKPDDVLRSR
jgi:LmbE family N-acetylglucosaminyl deacetylase